LVLACLQSVCTHATKKKLAGGAKF